MPVLFSTGTLLLLVLGVPDFLVLLLPVLATLGTTTATPPVLVIQRMFSGIDKFPLMAIPFFIAAGNIMAEGGISRRLIRLARAIVSPVPGGLAVTTVMSSMFFGAISGSSPATVIAVGRIMLPSLETAGYSRPFSIGLLMSAGSLGNIIPPSIFMIVYGAVTGVSIGALFLAGIGAGIVYGAVFILICVLYAESRGLARTRGWDLCEIWLALRDSIWGLMTPLIILGGIYGGFFTPTEAAAIAVAYAIFVTMAVHREMSFRQLLACTVSSGVTTAQVMIIISAASAFSWFLATSGLSQAVGEILSLLGDNPIWVLLAINAIVVVAGMILDPISLVIILVPFISPVAEVAGIDPLLLGIVMAVNASIGMFSPPFGLNLFISTGLGVSYREAILGALPFMAVGLFALMIVSYIPVLTIWLPSLFYSGVSF